MVEKREACLEIFKGPRFSQMYLVGVFRGLGASYVSLLRWGRQSAHLGSSRADGEGSGAFLDNPGEGLGSRAKPRSHRSSPGTSKGVVGSSGKLIRFCGYRSGGILFRLVTNRTPSVSNGGGRGNFCYVPGLISLCRCAFAWHASAWCRADVASSGRGIFLEENASSFRPRAASCQRRSCLSGDD